MCVDRNRQADQIHTMKYVTIAEWFKQLRTDYPHVVHVSHCTGQQKMLMQSWLVSHIGPVFDTWANVHPEYRFKRESDAVQFSMVFT